MIITKYQGSDGTVIFQPQSDDSKISDAQIQGLKVLKNGDEFYLNGVLVEMPDSTNRLIPSKKIKLVKSELYADIWQNMYHDVEGKFSIGKQYCNIRLQIDPNIPKAQKDTISKFINEINQVLLGVKIKIVTQIPNFVIKQSEEQYYRPNSDYQNFFYPRAIGCNTNCSNYIGKDAEPLELVLSCILDFVGAYAIENKIEKDKFGYYHLTSRCKKFLQLLYSDNGINNIYKELNIENPNDYRKDYTLIIVILSFIIFLILRELIQSISITRTFFIKKTSWWKQLMSCLAISQLPLIMIFLIQHNNEIKIEWIDILTAEKYYLIYTAIVSTMLWGLDKLQIRIKQFSFRLLFDFILTIVIFWGAYQLLFIVTHLDYVRVDMFRWQWIYIPLVVAIYRIYNLYNQRKIDQLLQEKELEISKQKELTTKAELLALQSRINPHFLYNSLNSIASLTTIDAHKAEQMSVNLAKLFRYNLNKTDDLMTTIECELEMVKLYLNIEKQRFGDRLVYLVDVPSELMTFQIPIFLLQPLVENAIKHGLSKITEQGVLKIKISMSENQLIIKVYDNGPLFTNDLIFGYGLQNIFDKLTLVYKNNYTVRFVNESDKHIEIGITEVRIMNTEVRIQN
jgi:sensor histidine kinase YesM